MYLTFHSVSWLPFEWKDIFSRIRNTIVAKDDYISINISFTISSVKEIMSWFCPRCHPQILRSKFSIHIQNLAVFFWWSQALTLFCSFSLHYWNYCTMADPWIICRKESRIRYSFESRQRINRKKRLSSPILSLSSQGVKSTTHDPSCIVKRLHVKAVTSFCSRKVNDERKERTVLNYRFEWELTQVSFSPDFPNRRGGYGIREVQFPSITPLNFSKRIVKVQMSFPNIE